MVKAGLHHYVVEHLLISRGRVVTRIIRQDQLYKIMIYFDILSSSCKYFSSSQSAAWCLHSSSYYGGSKAVGC